MRPHVFEDIPGWFDFDDIYLEQVSRASSGATFVEIGGWLGRSSAFMAVEIANSGKRIDFFVVDTWRGSPGEQYHQDMVRTHGGSVFQLFEENMHRSGVNDFVKPLVMSSREAVDRFADESIDFVFIDGCHDFPVVREDISLWRQKVKPGGVLAGHDIEWPGLRQAVQDVLPWSEVEIRRSSWYWRKDVATRGEWLRPTSPAAEASVPSHFLFIPAAACPDLVQRAASSIGLPWVNGAVVDASGHGLSLENFSIPQNLGVFRAQPRPSFTQLQNWAQAEVRRRRVKWLLFMHADAECADESVIADLLRFAEAGSYREKVGVIFTHYDALCAFHRDAIADVGAWDETFAWYSSDCDYYRRMRLRGWKTIDWPDAARVRHRGSASIRSDAALAADVRRQEAFVRDHYLHKWGGPIGQERFSIPYNGRA